MVKLTIRDLPDEIHRALRTRAASHGHSMEAEVEQILTTTVNPESRVKLDALLADIGRRAALTEEEFSGFDRVKDSDTKGKVSSQSLG